MEQFARDVAVNAAHDAGVGKQPYVRVFLRTFVSAVTPHAYLGPEQAHVLQTTIQELFKNMAQLKEYELMLMAIQMATWANSIHTATIVWRFRAI